MNDLYVKTIRATLLGMVAFAALIFLPAWTLNYWQGWAYFGTFSIASALVTVYMAIFDKKLLERRLRAGPSAEATPTQKIIVTLVMAGFVASIIIPALDHRFRWSPAVPAYLSVTGDALVALSYFMIFFVLRENSYGASTISVTDDQKVISTGPYAMVRHPMYAATLPMIVGTPLALDSWWGLLMVPLFIAVLIWRLLDEERFLHKNLPGYTEYTRNVTYRLVPYIW